MELSTCTNIQKTIQTPRPQFCRIKLHRHAKWIIILLILSMICMRGRLHIYYEIISEISNINAYIYIFNKSTYHALFAPYINFHVNWTKLARDMPKNH